MQTSRIEVVIKLYASTTILTPGNASGSRYLLPIPRRHSSCRMFKEPLRHIGGALKKRGHVRDLRRRVPHIKSLRRSVTDERAPSPVHFVIHISQHARATRRKERMRRGRAAGEEDGR